MSRDETSKRHDRDVKRKLAECASVEKQREGAMRDQFRGRRLDAQRRWHRTLIRTRELSDMLA
ncbi:MAG: hypothetical protein J0H37_09950 [Hyphomicrobium denitrificans]|nr:hypothetical protein [Hyphomicrobium denitrificans]